VNASLQVYPFRVFSGDVRQAFSRTLLRREGWSMICAVMNPDSLIKSDRIGVA
jgi:hypothetical protein